MVGCSFVFITVIVQAGLGWAGLSSVAGCWLGWPIGWAWLGWLGWGGVVERNKKKNGSQREEEEEEEEDDEETNNIY